jgi:hypothetical protein
LLTNPQGTLSYIFRIIAHPFQISGCLENGSQSAQVTGKRLLQSYQLQNLFFYFILKLIESIIAKLPPSAKIDLEDEDSD